LFFLRAFNKDIKIKQLCFSISCLVFSSFFDLIRTLRYLYKKEVLINDTKKRLIKALRHE